MTDKFFEPVKQYALDEVEIRRSPEHRQRKVPPVTMSQSIINGLNSPVAVYGRTGLGCWHPPSTGMDVTGELIIRVTYTWTRGTAFDYAHVLERNGDNLNKELSAIREIRRVSEEESLHGTLTKLEFDYVLDIDTIEDCGDSVYLTQLDLLVTISPDERKHIHPFQDKATRQNIIAEDRFVKTKEAFGYSIHIIDNSDECKLRAVNINGRVYHVPHYKKPGARSGVYVIHSGEVTRGNVVRRPRVTRYDFDEVPEDLHLFSRIEDAEVMGDWTSRRQEELNELQHENKKLYESMKSERMELEHEISKENARLSQEHERELNSLKREKQQMENHYKQIETERKNHYDRISAERKDSGEFLKMIPIVVTGVVSLAALWSKFNS